MEMLSVLIIEDHPFTAEAYKNAFKAVSDSDANYSFKIWIAHSCDEAYKLIVKHPEDEKIDVFFLDINLPPSKNGKILSGEDLGLVIRKRLKKAKIVVSTSHYDSFRINNIIKSINPEGFLVKNDININEIISAIKKILSSPPYYSQTVLESLRKSMSHSVSLDEIDRKILYELSIGTKMIELPNQIPMSIAGIEKRKRHIAKKLNVSPKDNRKLIETARNKGFI